MTASLGDKCSEVFKVAILLEAPRSHSEQQKCDSILMVLQTTIRLIHMIVKTLSGLQASDSGDHHCAVSRNLSPDSFSSTGRLCNLRKSRYHYMRMEHM